MNKRVFFALDAFSPWPENWPKGRVIEKNNRHITLAFLGDISFEKLVLDTFPKPDFSSGFGGRFIQPLFLPEKDPRLVAWQVDFFDKMQKLQSYQEKLISWLQGQGFKFEPNSSFMPHMTICRDPENFEEWKQNFQVLPMYFSNICLQMSLGHSEYKMIWQYPLQKPFTDLHHTADLAFFIYGETFLEIYQNARVALSFDFPSLIQPSLDKQSLSSQKPLSKIEDVIIELNDLIAEVDIQEGIDLKAVSFHGKVTKKDNLYQWEMIVDV